MVVDINNKKMAFIKYKKIIYFSLFTDTNGTMCTNIDIII